MARRIESSHRGTGSNDARARTRRKVTTGPWARLATLALAWLAAVASDAASETYRLETIASQLRWPWSVARLPDGGFLVTEREGRLLHLYPDGRRTVVEGGPATLFAGQGGYLDVVLDNRFGSNGLIYISYAEGEEDANATAVYRARLSEDRLEDGVQILRVVPDKTTPQHYGGRLLALEDNSLLMTTGDGFEHREAAQDWDSELGKVLRFDSDGTPAGVLAPGTDATRRIWTLGHRNPQGLAIDGDDGAVYLHEHGPRGGDEINLLNPGHNYGWPVVTEGVDYSGAYVSPFRAAPGMREPLWTWTPSIAPSGLALYRGNDFPAWRGSLFVGALAAREVRRLQLVDRRIVDEEALFGELGARIRDVRVFDNDLFLLTDGEEASLIQVLPY